MRREYENEEPEVEEEVRDRGGKGNANGSGGDQVFMEEKRTVVSEGNGEGQSRQRGWFVRKPGGESRDSRRAQERWKEGGGFRCQVKNFGLHSISCTSAMFYLLGISQKENGTNITTAIC